ncbi:MAG: hypothetical protein Q7R46_00260 [bacterium]|nr:hypothetical protein [bacterium]
MKEIIFEGKIKSGLRIASGLNPDPTLKLNNTIFKQKKFFVEAGVAGIQNCYNGTINVDIQPYQFKIIKPDYEVTCEWSPGTVETFWFVGVDINLKGKNYDGYIYYPCPSPVKNHKDDTVELLAPKIENLRYGDPISIKIDADKVEQIELADN